MPGRVVEQVGEHLVESGGIGHDPQVSRNDRHDVRDPPSAQRRLSHRALDQLENVDGSEVEANLPSVETAEVEQVAHEGAEPLGLGQRRSEHVVVGANHAVDEVLEQRLLGREGRAQLVRHGGDELAPLPVGVGQVGGHGVEGRSQPTDLVGGCRRDPAGVVARRHPAGRVGHLPQR